MPLQHIKSTAAATTLPRDGHPLPLPPTKHGPPTCHACTHTSPPSHLPCPTPPHARLPLLRKCGSRAAALRSFAAARAGCARFAPSSAWRPRSRPWGWRPPFQPATKTTMMPRTAPAAVLLAAQEEQQAEGEEEATWRMVGAWAMATASGTTCMGRVDCTTAGERGRLGGRERSGLTGDPEPAPGSGWVMGVAAGSLHASHLSAFKMGNHSNCRNVRTVCMHVLAHMRGQ